MKNASEHVAYYLDRLKKGETEDAFFNLIDPDSAVFSALIDACFQNENRAIRDQIVKCIWQHRVPESVCVLIQLLDDPEWAVWQEALDGLVAIGGQESIRALQEIRNKLQVDSTGRTITAEWIDEALEQIRK